MLCVHPATAQDSVIVSPHHEVWFHHVALRRSLAISMCAYQAVSRLHDSYTSLACRREGRATTLWAVAPSCNPQPALRRYAHRQVTRAQAMYTGVLWTMDMAGSR